LRPEAYNRDWERAIKAIRNRFQERFIRPIEAIRAKDRSSKRLAAGRGFAITALDCLILESLYGFERGWHTQSRETTIAFAELLEKKGQFRGDFSAGLAAKFGAAVRNGLLHDGETRGGWIIWKGEKGEPIVLPLGGNLYALNRDHFHAAVKAILDEYFAKLLSSTDPNGVELRRTFKDRVNELCRDSKP